MKLNKRMAQWSGAIASIAFIISLFTNFCCDSECSSYATNVLIGLFSSGILVCVTSVISYFHDRNKLLYLLYEGCSSFKNILQKNLRADNQIDIYTARENFSNMMDSYRKDIYYHVCELANLHKRSKLNKMVMDIWEQARHLYLFVVEDDEKITSFLIGEISKEDIQYYKFRYVGDEAVEYMKKLNTAQDALAYRMNYYNIRKGKREEQNNAD